SAPQALRISRSLRTTDRRLQSSRAAISGLVYPSIFRRATRRSPWSRKPSSRRPHSSAAIAANSGLGSDPPSAARPAVAGPGSAPRRAPPRARPPAPLLPRFPPGLVRHLPGRDGHQQPPEVIAVGQVGEPPPRQPGVAVREGAQGGILFIGRPPGPRPEL